jgi:hypothetical protein
MQGRNSVLLQPGQPQTHRYGHSHNLTIFLGLFLGTIPKWKRRLTGFTRAKRKSSELYGGRLCVGSSTNDKLTFFTVAMEAQRRFSELCPLVGAAKFPWVRLSFGDVMSGYQ